MRHKYSILHLNCAAQRTYLHTTLHLYRYLLHSLRTGARVNVCIRLYIVKSPEPTRDTGLKTYHYHNYYSLVFFYDGKPYEFGLSDSFIVHQWLPAEPSCPDVSVPTFNDESALHVLEESIDVFDAFGFMWKKHAARRGKHDVLTLNLQLQKHNKVMKLNSTFIKKLGLYRLNSYSASHDN